MASHSSTLAWKIPWTEEPGRLQSMGPLRVGHDWATSLSLFAFMHWRRKRQPTPVFLPGESQRRGSLGGLLSMGSHRIRHDWSDLAAAAMPKPHLVSGPLLWQAKTLSIYLFTRRETIEAAAAFENTLTGFSLMLCGKRAVISSVVIGILDVSTRGIVEPLGRLVLRYSNRSMLWIWRRRISFHWKPRFTHTHITSHPLQ